MNTKIKLNSLAKKYGFDSEDFIFALNKLGLVKPDGTPYSKYVNNETFTKRGEFNYNKNDFEENYINDIEEKINMKHNEDKMDLILERIDELEEKMDSILEKLDEFDVVDDDEDEEEEVKKPKQHREVDMSTRARSLIGKKINGWVITGEKLEVVATKNGKEIRAPGMKKREDFEAMLK